MSVKIGRAFSKGDKVTVNGHAGVISKNWYSPVKGHMYEVVFDNQNLIPPHMDVPQADLRPHTNRSRPTGHSRLARPWKGRTALPEGRVARVNLNSDTHCPVCQTKWNIVQVFRDVWYDCLKCGKKREDIENERN